MSHKKSPSQQRLEELQDWARTGGRPKEPQGHAGKKIMDEWRAETRKADDARIGDFLRRLYESARPRTAAEELALQQRKANLEEFDGDPPQPPPEPRYDPAQCPVGYVAYEGRTFSSLIDEIQGLQAELRDNRRELRNLREQLVLSGGDQ